MDPILSVEQYAQEMRRYKNSPQKLADLHIEMAAKYAFLSEIAKDLQLERAQFWGKKYEGEKPLSDTYLETKWRLTEGGRKELKMKYELKALQNLMGAIKTSSVVTSIEARNTI